MGTPPITHFAGVSVLFVMATEHEYGPRLRECFVPLMIGVGPVEAAVNTSRALGALAASGQHPDLIVSLGSAGSRTLDHAAVYQVASVSYRDMDASALGFDKGQTPFADFPPVVAIQNRIQGLPAASLATGASVVSGTGYDGIEAQMVDMETFAVVRAASSFSIPVIGLRGISDGPETLTGLHDWTEYLALIDKRLAASLDVLRDHVLTGNFALAESGFRPSHT